MCCNAALIGITEKKSTKILDIAQYFHLSHMKLTNIALCQNVLYFNGYAFQNVLSFEQVYYDMH